jgi:hypothetical protein
MNEFQLIKELNDLGSDERMMVLSEIIAGLSHDQRRELREELCPPDSTAAGDHAPVKGTWSWAVSRMDAGLRVRLSEFSPNWSIGWTDGGAGNVLAWYIEGREAAKHVYFEKRWLTDISWRIAEPAHVGKES